MSRGVGKSTFIRFKTLEDQHTASIGGKEQLGEIGYGQTICLRRASTRLEYLSVFSARRRTAPIRDETLRIDLISIAFLWII